MAISSVTHTDSENPMLAAALEWAGRGFEVLPLHSIDDDGGCTCAKPKCSSPGKHPRTPHGYKDASRDLEVITDWFAGRRGVNLGVVPGSGGAAVVDIDPRNADPQELTAWLHEKADDFDGSPIVETGQYGDTRGQHIWFAADKSESLTHAQLPKGVETKSTGGYVLVPPSTHASGARYELVGGDFETMRETPEWLIESAGGDARPISVIPGQLTGLPMGEFALRAIEHGLTDTRDDGPQRPQAVAIARNIREAGVHEVLARLALRAVLLHPGTSLRPGDPWTEKHADEIVASVYAGPAPDQHAYLRGESPRLEVRSLADAFSSEHVETEWLIRGLLARGDKALVVGQPKAGKTFFALHIARSVATGEPFLSNEEWRTEDTGPVLFVEEEHGLSKWDERLRMVFEDSRGAPFHYVHHSNMSLANSERVTELSEVARSIDARLIVLDPWQRLIPGINENDAADTEPAWSEVHRLARAANAAVLLVHHANKGGSELGFDSIRGSSRMRGEVDLTVLLAKRKANRIELRIEGRDVAVDSDARLFAEYEPDRPHALKFKEDEIKAKPRKFTREAASSVLMRDGGWIKIARLTELIEAELGDKRNRETVRKVLHELADDGAAEMRTLSDGNETTEWKWVSQ